MSALIMGPLAVLRNHTFKRVPKILEVHFIRSEYILAISVVAFLLFALHNQ